MEKSALTGRRDGILAAIGAYLIWGLVPIFFKQLGDVPAGEIIAHRMLWSLLLMTAVIAVSHGFEPAWKVACEPARLFRVVVAAALVTGNWLTFVYGVNAGRILETSLGYFILPLVNVALGVLVLKERLRPVQWLAVALAVSGVALQTLHLGQLPWISLVLAGTFGCYGLLRKQMPLDAASGLFLETACMTPFALLYLSWLYLQGVSSFGIDWPRDGLLIASGAVTAIPLLLFAIGARRLPLNVLGFLQYLAPTLSFLVAVFVYGEAMNTTRLASFALIWAALAVFTTDLVRHRTP